MRADLMFCAAQLAAMLLVTPPAVAKCGPCDSHYSAASRFYSQRQYARAVNEYSHVGGNAFCRFLANYYSAASNYSRVYGLQEAATIQSDASNSEAVSWQLRDSVTDQLRTALSLGSSPEIGRCADAVEQTQVHRVIGQAKYTLALLLERAQRDPREILRLLDGYEASYPEVKSPNADVFVDVAEWRLRALESLGNYAQAEHQVIQLVESHARNDPDHEFVRSLGSRFLASASYKLGTFDEAGGMRDANLTILLYQPFEAQLRTSAHSSSG